MRLTRRRQVICTSYLPQSLCYRWAGLSCCRGARASCPRTRSRRRSRRRSASGRFCAAWRRCERQPKMVTVRWLSFGRAGCRPARGTQTRLPRRRSTTGRERLGPWTAALLSRGAAFRLATLPAAPCTSSSATTTLLPRPSAGGRLRWSSALRAGSYARTAHIPVRRAATTTPSSRQRLRRWRAPPCARFRLIWWRSARRWCSLA